MKSVALLGVAILLALPAAAQTVTDGDTIRLDGTTYRLHGIDAAESRQDCPDGWPAGKMASQYLHGLMRGHRVTCEPKTLDRYGRAIALCLADGRDLGADMVSAGMALAFVKYSRDYILQEAAAKAGRRGVHDHDCLSPWEHRARERGDR